MLLANWLAPKNIIAGTLTKLDSVDTIPFPLKILDQIHEATVIELPNNVANNKADGVYTQKTNTPCSIRTADCLAIFLTNQQGNEIAALHGGWRGLAKGIIHEGVKKFKAPREEMIAWLSPSICAKHYETDTTVYEYFVKQNEKLRECFEPTRPDHWFCDLTKIAQLQLEALGVKEISKSDLCTFENETQLYSYRREPNNPGRLIHTIWIAA